MTNPNNNRLYKKDGILNKRAHEAVIALVNDERPRLVELKGGRYRNTYSYTRGTYMRGVLEDAGVSAVVANDAPRGGKLGDYYELDAEDRALLCEWAEAHS